MERLQVRSIRVVNDRVNGASTTGVLVQLALCVMTLILGNLPAAFGCLGVALLLSVASAISARERRNAVIELRPDVIVGRALGQEVFQLGVAEVDSAMRLGPRKALLRTGNQKIVLELQPESPRAELDALFALVGKRGRASAPLTVAIQGLELPLQIPAVLGLVWMGALLLARWREPALPRSPAALAMSLGVMVSGEIVALALAFLGMKRSALVVGEHEIVLRGGRVFSGPAEEIFPLATIRAIELDDGRLLPSITLAFADGGATRVTPLAREETAAVARELQRRLARSRALAPETAPSALVAQAGSAGSAAPRASEPPAPVDRVPLEVSRARAFFGGRAAMSFGADGLLVRRGAKTTFFPFAELRAVSVTPVAEGARGSRAEILLHGEDGRRHEIGVSAAPMDVGSLSLRLAQAVRAHHGEAPAGCARLARGERSIAAWRADLAATGGPAAASLAFRSSPLEAEHLHEILASPRASLEERVGAALALRAATPAADLRARLRVEAAATADPRLRIALEVVAADELDEERLDAALAAAAALR